MLLGALVPLASIPMAAVLLVGMFTVHLPYGFSSIKLQAVTAAGAQFGPPGYETDLLYLACLAALVLGGSGPLAIEGLLVKRRKGGRYRSGVTTSESRPHIIIIGAGFAGLFAAKALAKAPVHVTLIDRQNYHLFQPLLY